MKSLTKEIENLYINTRDRLHKIDNFIQENSHIKIIGYTAPAKATTLISGLNKESQKKIKFIIDDAPFKRNKFIPGTKTKVVSQAEINNQLETADNNEKLICILFAWNIADTLYDKIKKSKLLPSETTYVTPLPTIKVIDNG